MLHHLRTIKFQLSKSHLSSLDKLAYWAAFSLAFYGFLRASEFTAPSPSWYSSTEHLTVGDVSCSTNSVRIVLRHSKTNQFGKVEPITVGSNGTSTCPLRAMVKYLARRAQFPHGPLFILSSGRYMTRKDVSNTTKTLLRRAGFNPSGFSSHSYRIGAATTAAAVGLPDHLIQRLGRWRSNTYQVYIRPTTHLLRDATGRMAHPH